MFDQSVASASVVLSVFLSPSFRFPFSPFSLSLSISSHLFLYFYLYLCSSFLFGASSFILSISPTLLIFKFLSLYPFLSIISFFFPASLSAFLLIFLPNFSFLSMILNYHKKWPKSSPSIPTYRALIALFTSNIFLDALHFN